MLWKMAGFPSLPSCQHLDFSPVRLLLDLTSKKINLNRFSATSVVIWHGGIRKEVLRCIKIPATARHRWWAGWGRPPRGPRTSVWNRVCLLALWSACSRRSDVLNESKTTSALTSTVCQTRGLLSFTLMGPGLWCLHTVTSYCLLGCLFLKVKAQPSQPCPGSCLNPQKHALSQPRAFPGTLYFP